MIINLPLLAYHKQLEQETLTKTINSIQTSRTSVRSFFNTHTGAKTNTKNQDTRKDLITMFREDNHSYYRPDCNNTCHTVTIVRQPKKKELLDSKQWNLRVAKRRLCHVDPDNHNEIQSLKRKIHKLEREIETIQSMEIPHKNLHKCDLLRY